jgi:hypothetical protein
MSKRSKHKQKMRGPSRPVDPRYTARRVAVRRRGPEPFAIWLVGISTALALLVVFWVAFGNRNSNPQAQGPTTVAAIPTVPQPTVGPVEGTATANAFATETGTLPHVSVDELKALLAANNVKLVDVRVKTEYDKKHIKGATSVPEAEMFNRIKDLPKEGNLVLYCQ